MIMTFLLRDMSIFHDTIWHLIYQYDLTYKWQVWSTISKSARWPELAFIDFSRVKAIFCFFPEDCVENLMGGSLKVDSILANFGPGPAEL